MIYAMASAKGGVGKTTVTANLGIMLTKMGKKTLLVDTDLASGSLTLHLGLKRPPTSLHELLFRNAGPITKEAIRGAIHQGPGGVSILPSKCSLRGFLGSNVDMLPEVISKVSEDYDLVLIDTPPGINKNSIVPLTSSDEVLLVTTPDKNSVFLTSITREVAAVLEREVRGAVLNKQEKVGFFGKKQLKTGEIEAGLGTEVLGTIPEDKNVEKAIEAGVPIVLHKPKASASKAFKNLSSKFLKEVEHYRKEKPEEPSKA